MVSVPLVHDLTRRSHPSAPDEAVPGGRHGRRGRGVGRRAVGRRVVLLLLLLLRRRWLLRLLVVVHGGRR